MAITSGQCTVVFTHYTDKVMVLNGAKYDQNEVKGRNVKG